MKQYNQTKFKPILSSLLFGVIIGNFILLSSKIITKTQAIHLTTFEVIIFIILFLIYKKLKDFR